MAGRSRAVNGAARTFASDNDGAVAVIFALMIVPLIVAIGAAIDYGRASNLHAEIQAAADAAVIAGARELMRSNEADKAVAAAEASFATSQAASRGVKFDVEIDRDERRVSGAASANVPTTFMALAGVMDIDVSAEAVAVAPEPKVGSGRRGGPALNIDEEKIADVVYQLETFCYQLRSYGGADRQVKACNMLGDGTFEKALRQRIASNGDTSDIVPKGIRLTQ